MNDSASNGTEARGPLPAADVVVDYLIVGTGPAGASLACFLAQNGMTGLMVSRERGSADTPRAHITNMAALDCLRDIGVDEACYRLGTTGDSMIHTRWSDSMAGEEYGRIYAWGNDPKRKGDYELASPSAPLDLPQTELEPLLVRYATLNGFQCRWDTEFVSFVQEPDGRGVTTSLRDSVTGQRYLIRSKRLFGADGARSKVVKQLGLPMITRPSQGFAVNILLEADMAHLMEHRMGNLHYVMRPEKEHPEHAWIGCFRMVKPWHEWLCIVIPSPGAEKKARSPEEYVDRVREFIGDDSVEFKIKGISTWVINESAAEVFSSGNVYCLGDAVHRHPPNHGLGSNTCIQDAHNLAWKVAYVDQGLAGEELLQSYNAERQPVGLELVTQTNASWRLHRSIWGLLGNLEPTAAARTESFNLLKEDSARGRQRREDFQTALGKLAREEHGLGLEMNQRYTSTAVYKADEQDEGMAKATSSNDEDDYDVKYYHATTFPGARLPHVWLNRGAVPSTPKISTLDLAGKGRFALFTGIGGEEGWRGAAREVERELGVAIAVFAIGLGLEYEDLYLDWTRVRAVDDSGCVLVRPDRFVAWRSKRFDEVGGESAEQLRAVMESVLSRRANAA